LSEQATGVLKKQHSPAGHEQIFKTLEELAWQLTSAPPGALKKIMTRRRKKC
jgi:hypothetical protein